MEIKIETGSFQESRVVEDDLKSTVVETIDNKSNVKTLSDFEDSFLPYEKKHSALLKKCQSIQQGNDRLVNRIHRVRRLLKQLRKEKRSLMMRLDHYGDEYKNVPLGNNEIQDIGGLAETVNIKKSHSSMSLSKSHQLSQGSRSHQSGSSNSSSKKRSSTSNKHHNCGSLPKMLHSDKEEKSGGPPVKRPANPFFLFCQERRTAILDARQRQENKGELSHQELTRILAKNWNNLPVQEKKVYYRMYEKEKYRYEQEMKALSSSLNSSSNSFSTDIVIKKEIVDS